MPKKILIVDDEEHIRLLIEQTLEDLRAPDVKILSAENGEQALGLILTEAPRVVFLDVMIPKLNGFDLCRIVKKKEDDGYLHHPADRKRPGKRPCSWV